MFRCTLGLALVGIWGAVARGQAEYASEDDLRKLIQRLQPPPEIMKYQQIPWVLDLNEGIRLARAEKRPIFLWASGDDPLERC